METMPPTQTITTLHFEGQKTPFQSKTKDIDQQLHSAFSLLPLDPDGLGRQTLLAESETSAFLTRCATLKERFSPRQKSRTSKQKRLSISSHKVNHCPSKTKVFFKKWMIRSPNHRKTLDEKILLALQQSLVLSD